MNQGWDLGVPVVMGAIFLAWCAYQLGKREVLRILEQRRRMSDDWMDAYRRHPSGRA